MWKRVLNRLVLLDDDLGLLVRGIDSAAVWSRIMPCSSYSSVGRVLRLTARSFALSVNGTSLLRPRVYEKLPDILLVTNTGFLTSLIVSTKVCRCTIKLLDPMELSESQTQEYLSRPFKEKPEGFSFPEDLLPSCTRVDSNVPMMTMVNCLIEMLRSGGDYLFLRKLWGHFRATLASENPLYSLTWSRGESLVRHFCVFLFLLFL